MSLTARSTMRFNASYKLERIKTVVRADRDLREVQITMDLLGSSFLRQYDKAAKISNHHSVLSETIRIEDGQPLLRCSPDLAVRYDPSFRLK